MASRWNANGLGRLGALLLVALATALGPGTATAASPDVVLSEVYVAGGSASSAYDSSFVELFNRGTATVQLAGWSLQARALDGRWVAAPLAGAIEPGRFYLVRLTSPLLGLGPLPVEDVSVALPPLVGSAGSLALVTDGAPLACGAARGDCAGATTIRDLLGWGTATAAEGSPARSTTNATLGLSRVPGSRRAAAPCLDGDANRRDFRSMPPTPMGSAAPAVTCPPDAAPTVIGTTPANGAENVSRTMPLEIRFSEPVTFPRALVTCFGVSSELETSTGDGIAFAVGHLPFGYGEDCVLTIVATAVSDLDGNDPPDGLASDVLVSFATVPRPAATVLATVPVARAKAAADGRLTLPVRCSTRADDTCTGGIVLTMPAPRTGAAGTPRAIRIASGSFVLNRGLTRPIALRLSSAGRAALASRGRIAATATVRSTDASGTTITSTSRLTIEPRRAGAG